MYEQVLGYIYISKEMNQNEIHFITKGIIKARSQLAHEKCFKHLYNLNIYIHLKFKEPVPIIIANI